MKLSYIKKYMYHYNLEFFLYIFCDNMYDKEDVWWREKVKNFKNEIEILLVVLTFLSLIMSTLEYTNMIYNVSYDTTKLNDFVVSTPFSIVLWIDNILIILLSIFCVIDTIRQKKNVLLKISFCVISICSTMVVSTFIINAVAKLFGIF